MSILRKSLPGMLAVLLLIQSGAIVSFGASPENEKQTITISNIDTSQLTGDAAGSSTEIRTEGVPRSSIEVVSEEWSDITEYVISGRNISIRDGKYSYKLVIRSDRTLTFDNDLEIWYQGVNGKYKLHYDIDKSDNHTMIVTGTFDNIIISSPLLQKLSSAEREWILSHISRDSYFYQLVLKTKEGFSFMNTLRFFFDAKECGYSIKYSYDLLSDRQTLIISGIPADQASVDNENTAAENNANVVPEKAIAQAESIKTIVISSSRLRRKPQTIKASEIFDSGVEAQGKVTYTKISGHKKIRVNRKTGNVTVIKGLKKGTYTMAVKQKSKNKTASDRIVSFAVKVI